MNYSLYYPTLTQTSKHLNLCVIRLLSFNDIGSREFWSGDYYLFSQRGWQQEGHLKSPIVHPHNKGT